MCTFTFIYVVSSGQYLVAEVDGVVSVAFTEKSGRASDI